MTESEEQKSANNEEEEERLADDKVWDAFMAFDYDKSGYMQTSDLKNALEHLGETVTEEQTFLMIANADPANTGTIQFNQFKDLVDDKRANEGGSTEEELLEAFVAMGGQPDGDGFIDADKLIHTIKNEFEMTIDIEKLILDIDEDGSGEIEFDEFQQLLAGQAAGEAEDDD